MQNQETNDSQVATAIKSLAAASATPFRTAFKITLGILAAQLVASLIGLTVFAALCVSVFAILRK